MTPKNILEITLRADFRAWLAENHDKQTECWIEVKRGKMPPADGTLWYLDAVEEALCFGWIDSTLKRVDGRPLQRFGRRAGKSRWTELNKERCRRLEALGLMTAHGRAVCPDLSAPFETDMEIMAAFCAEPEAWANFNLFHPLYRRVRIDNIQRKKACPELFAARLQKLIEASRKGVMIGEWNDNGRLLEY